VTSVSKIPESAALPAVRDQGFRAANKAFYAFLMQGEFTIIPAHYEALYHPRKERSPPGQNHCRGKPPPRFLPNERESDAFSSSAPSGAPVCFLRETVDARKGAGCRHYGSENAGE